MMNATKDPKRILWALLISTSFFCTPAFAQPADSLPDTTSGAKDAQGEKAEGEKQEKEELIKTGTIASTGSYGFGPQTIESGATGAAPGDETSVITAGVSRKSKDECQITVSNTSEENSYSVSYRVIERNQRGSSINSKSFSSSLKPKGADTRDVPCLSDSRMEVELRSARKR